RPGAVPPAAAGAPVPGPRRPDPAPPVQRAAPARAPLGDVVSRRTLVTIAVVVALAIAATVLYLKFGPDGDDSENTGKKETASSAGASGSGSGSGETTPDGGTGKTADTGQGSGDDPAEKTPDGEADDKAGDDTEKDTEKKDESGKEGDSADAGKVPGGYKEVSNSRFRFEIAMPDGFRQTDESGRGSGAIFSKSGGFPRLQVDRTGQPGDDAAAAWTAAWPGTRNTSNDYKHLGIEEVEYNGYPTVADWQFERQEQGQRIRVLNRGFKVDDGNGYAIMVSCPAADWKKPSCTELRKTAFSTFKPTG
ncbi:serine/threonine protein kinase, partial [Streptomyces sp. NPDC000594]